MGNPTAKKLTDAVLAQLANTADPRLKQIMEGLIRHLHDFVREVELTPDEWLAAIKFLTAVGHKSDEQRQEFILLSDTLGLSMLVDAINSLGQPGITESSVLGPFYLEGAPELGPAAD